MEKAVYSIKEFCEAYGISRSTFYRLKKSCNLPAVTSILGRDKILLADAMEWALKNRKR